MAKPAGKKVDIEKIATQYLSRFRGQPDALRILMNLLADNLAHLDQLKEYIIKHEFNTSITQPKANKTVIIQQLSDTYGVSKTRVKEIVEE